MQSCRVATHYCRAREEPANCGVKFLRPRSSPLTLPSRATPSFSHSHVATLGTSRFAFFESWSGATPVQKVQSYNSRASSLTIHICRESYVATPAVPKTFLPSVVSFAAICRFSAPQSSTFDVATGKLQTPSALAVSHLFESTGGESRFAHIWTCHNVVVTRGAKCHQGLAVDSQAREQHRRQTVSLGTKQQ